MTPTKTELRKHYRALRAAMSTEACRKASLAICERIRRLPVFEASATVAIFFPLDREVDLRELTKTGKRILYPRLLDQKAKTMEFAPLDHAFVPGVFGLMEPDGEAARKDDIDLILVPGLAFDQAGRRIGYGAGYYDLYLKDYRGAIVGVAYEGQLAAFIPSASLDVSMHALVTDLRLIPIRS
jgi:5-formyltetrahydrofolate cyclo-ligase